MKVDFLVTVGLWGVAVDFWNAIVNLAIVDEARFVSLRNVFVQVNLTESIYNVVLPKSVPVQNRQLVLYYYFYKGHGDRFVREMTLVKAEDKLTDFCES